MAFNLLMSLMSDRAEIEVSDEEKLADRFSGQLCNSYFYFRSELKCYA